MLFQVGEFCARVESDLSGLADDLQELTGRFGKNPGTVPGFFPPIRGSHRWIQRPIPGKGWRFLTKVGSRSRPWWVLLFTHPKKRLFEAEHRVCVSTGSRDGDEQSIDWQNCAIGTLDRSYWAIRSAQIWAVFEEAKRNIGRIFFRELGWKQGRTLNLPETGPCSENKPIGLVVAYPLT